MTDASNTRFNAEAAAWDSNPDVHLASDNALAALLQHIPSLRPSTPPKGSKKPAVLELGCGTGLLSFRLAPYAESILAVDASAGMIDALSKKLAAADAPTNIHPLCILLEDPEDPRLPAAAFNSHPPPSTDANPEEVSSPASPSSPLGLGLLTHRRKYDLAVSHLVLHHLPDMAAVLKTLFGCLTPQTGQVFLTDFENFGPAARKFHPEAKMAGVERDGILASEIRGLLAQTGFVDVEVSVGWTQRKDVERTPGEWGQKKPDSAECESMEFPFLVMRGRRP